MSGRTLVRPDGRVVAPWEPSTQWPGSHHLAARNGREEAAVGVDFGTGQAGARHPLAEPALGSLLQHRAAQVAGAFERIEPVLRALARTQFDLRFAEMARHTLAESLGVDVPTEALTSSWSRPLDLGTVHAECVLQTFRNIVDRANRLDLAALEDGEEVAVLIQRFGFHAVDITSCADGRLGGVIDFILRVPPAVVTSRDSFAGAMFDVEAALHRWEAIELSRWREGVPNDVEDDTRYLKIGVYHFSSLDPTHQGCAAHGSDETRAATGLQQRLDEFAGAVGSVHGHAARVATLLVGVDTDTDAIRVHVPDAAGLTSVDRFISSSELYGRTADLERAAAKELIRDEVAECAGVDVDHVPTVGVRWLCGYLLKNNIGQVDAVRHAGGNHADQGHAERLAVVGDPVDDVQLRNLAFQAQMRTLEEGVDDLDVGTQILRSTHVPRGLAVPVLVHVSYDDRIPGADTQASARAARLVRAIEQRYECVDDEVGLVVKAVVRPRGASTLGEFEPRPVESTDHCSEEGGHA